MRVLLFVAAIAAAFTASAQETPERVIYAYTIDGQRRYTSNPPPPGVEFRTLPRASPPQTTETPKAAVGRWELIAIGDTGGVTASIDRATLSKSGDGVRVWVTYASELAPLGQMDSRPYYRQVVQELFRCSALTFAEIGGNGYGQDGSPVYSHFQQYPTQRPVVPGTINEMVMRAVCA